MYDRAANDHGYYRHRASGLPGFKVSIMLKQILNSKLDSGLRYVFIMGGKNRKSIDLMI